MTNAKTARTAKTTMRFFWYLRNSEKGLAIVKAPAGENVVYQLTGLTGGVNNDYSFSVSWSVSVRGRNCKDNRRKFNPKKECRSVW